MRCGRYRLTLKETGYTVIFAVELIVLPGHLGQDYPDLIKPGFKYQKKE